MVSGKSVPCMNQGRGVNMKKALSAVILVTFLASAALVLMAWPEKTAGQEGSYMGTDQCAACHEARVAEFRLSIHGQRGFEMRSSHACETCHGPGKTHVDAGGGKGTMITIPALSKARQSEMCLKCHDRGNKTDWAGSYHETRGLACEDCHSVHSPGSDKAQL